MLQRLGSDAQDTLSFESCSSSMACDVEAVSSESSKRMKDMDETTSEASDRCDIRCGAWCGRVMRRSLKP